MIIRMRSGTKERKVNIKNGSVKRAERVVLRFRKKHRLDQLSFIEEERKDAKTNTGK